MSAPFRVRQAGPDDARAIAEVHIASWKTTYPGIVPDALLESLDVAQREDRWKHHLSDPGSWTTYVAELDEGQIAGFVTGGAAREGEAEFTGELGAIYLLKEFQGQGIGRALATRLAGELVNQGHNSMIVWVLARNPFRRFYEALGGQLVRSRREEHGGVLLAEVAYGWRTLTSDFPGIKTRR